MERYQKEYRTWCKATGVDAQTRAELLQIEGNEQEIRDRFYCDLSFGTAGMRGILGAGSNRMNRYTVRRATLGFARFLQARHTAQALQRGVVIAHDNRHMSREFCMETAGVLAAAGIKAYIFDALRPTPELSFAVRHLGAIGGVMITASHNPPEYNGYKLYDEQGCQLMPRYTEPLTKIINGIEDPLSIRSLTPAQAGELIEQLSPSVDEAYYRAVMEIRLREVDASSVTVVYSPQHGTGNRPVREVLARCGYRVIPVTEQCEPDPDFSGTESPNPENPASFARALEYAKREGADVAIITDPDCDRLGVVARRGGEYAQLTGNQSGAILLEYILSTHVERGTLPANAVMCNTVVTSPLGDRICARYGVEVQKTLTGFKFIGDKIHTFEQSGSHHFIFGYEESYGCLISPLARDKDGVQASLLLCEAAAYYKAQGKTLFDVLEELYHAHGYFEDATTAVTHEGAEGAAKISAMVERLRTAPPRAAGALAVASLEDYESEQLQAMGFPRSNMLRFLMQDGSFVAVRPSGTEPKCKYYYCVCGDSREQTAEKLAAMRRTFEQ